MSSRPIRCSRCETEKALADFPPSKAKRPGQWCRQCLREDARRRKGLTASERTVVCGRCETPFSTTYTKAQFCSRECKTTARNADRSAATIAAKPDRSCVWCGQPMPKAMRLDAKFCSEQCNSDAHRATRKAAQRSGLTNRQGELISLAYIGDRDRWRCGLCGGRVTRMKAHPDPNAPSIDHIIPVSRGGSPDDPANLQLAHLGCNLSKRDRPAGEQLRLIG